MRLNVLILFLFLLIGQRTKAEVPLLIIDSAGYVIDTVQLDTQGNEISELRSGRPNPILQLIKKKQKKNKRIVAAILAFPFPFGIVGLHRIYLGTAPHVPVVYIGSLGGIFGILPFIDFCVLVLDKDIDRYINNPKIFMWVND